MLGPVSYGLFALFYRQRHTPRVVLYQQNRPLVFFYDNLCVYVFQIKKILGKHCFIRIARPDGSFSVWLRQQNLVIVQLLFRLCFLARRKNLSLVPC